MPDQKTLTVQERMRLDKLLVRTWPELHRRAVRDMLKEGQVSINGQPARKPGQYVEPGDEVVAAVPEVEAPPEPAYISPHTLEIVHEDEAFLVIDKPAGLLTHAKRRAEGETLAQMVAEAYPEMAHVGGVDRAGIVQRMETEVSGLLLAARNEEVYRTLKRMVKRQQVERRYSVLVDGLLSGEETIDAPIGNVKNTRKRRLMVAREGRTAITYFRALRTYRSEGRHYTLLDVRPETGRLHQIRVHLAWLGTPVVGDTIYGSSRQWVLSDRLFMHLSLLSLPHPVSEEPMQVSSALPEELASILRFMARPGP
jgi:23S rRNA pseudouridine1911/1915/1917 synthase